ncbi:hypothetical protein [Vibrio parahaemolyticus]|uniref:hypothetical protein n=1 Tax=Vibrio parahaemolyticus TaxID=670 RepID=UPI002362AE24|nr:hypothetical protein [Vibrio parahaemolyticus]
MKFIKLLALVLSFQCFAQSQELHLSQNVVLDVPLSKTILHTGNILIFKFGDSHISHEVLSPKEFFSPIDLTGVEKEFVRSLFKLTENSSFPQWLNAASNELSETLGITKDNKVIEVKGGLEILGFYDSESQSGQLFILDTSLIHHFTVLGSDELFKNLYQSIREKNNEFNN